MVIGVKDAMAKEVSEGFQTLLGFGILFRLGLGGSLWY